MSERSYNRRNAVGKKIITARGERAERGNPNGKPATVAGLKTTGFEGSYVASSALNSVSHLGSLSFEGSSIAFSSRSWGEGEGGRIQTRG